MTEANQNTQSAVIMKGGRELLELSAEEYIFPIVIDGKKVYVHMKRNFLQDLKEIREILKAVRIKFQAMDNDTIEQEPGNKMRFIPFFDRTFIKVTGVYIDRNMTEPTIDQQKKWLDRNPDLKIMVVNVGGSMKFEPEKEDTMPIDGILIALDSDTTIVSGYVDVAYFDPSSNGHKPLLPTDVSIIVDHVMKFPSEQDRISFNKATNKREVHTRKAEWTNKMNYDEMIRLYDDLIIRVDGVLNYGNELSVETKDSWKTCVPPFWKIQVVRDLFRENKLKN